MKQSLQLRLGQQLTMTPQLQQAIRLLQLSTLDLQLEIQQTLDKNIMLETVDEGFDNEEGNKEEETSEPTINNSEAEVNLEKTENLPEELPVDSNWEDTYDTGLNHIQDYISSNSPNTASGAKSSESEPRDFLDYNSSTETLHDHLSWQLELTPFTDVDRVIAMMIIDAIDEQGFLQTSLESIVESLDNPEVTEDEARTVLLRIQHFDPTGIGARDLGECLLLQLRQLDENTPWMTQARILLTQYLDVMAARDYTQLMRKMKLNREELQAVLELIQTLNPRPGNQIESSKTPYVVPDVFVKKVKGRWQVELNPDVAPKLRVNSLYAQQISHLKSRDDSDKLKEHLQEARWFIKSLRSRHETLLKVTLSIVERQSGFLDYGEEAMKPLVLHDIATELEMHESTISRVTTQKYIHTPRGIFELKYFFSSHVSTSTGGECSSTAIRALIKKLIAAENTAKPLSDNKIATILSEQGIKVARRTVAKYREAMVIPPSNERKCLV
ncbi:RNA polymerase factor sigma-54 [Candidatus Venteria ishoeyi]|uniref:RNA polymerase sigma-54 factor n=1 Tax=Candidatus Venteria ishoeyi TaxID=1899563 RepID=A0A1H6FEM7_9GAMM|nr:RNA polymerase factor sigma-54 [Candidatus Venteria ishoeyi]SEH07454.1 RNA polymerase sigma-54 factor [Candidatus Venteria ishoeyi]